MTTSRKRKLPDAIGPIKSRKMTGLCFNGNIQVTVNACGIKHLRDPRADVKFDVYKDVICQHSEYFRELCARTVMTEFVVHDVHPAHFKAYLHWIHGRELDGLIDGDTGPEQHGRKLETLCHLLLMSVSPLKDADFGGCVLRMLLKVADEEAEAYVPLEVEIGSQLWEHTIPEHQLRPWLVKWASSRLTRKGLANKKPHLDPSFFLALEKAVPNIITLEVGRNESMKTFSIDETVACSHSDYIRKIWTGSFTPFTIKLPGHDPSIMQKYVDCISKGRVELEDFVTARLLTPESRTRTVKSLSGATHALTLEQEDRIVLASCKLWLLCDILQDSKTKRQAMQHLLWASSIAQLQFTKDTVRTIGCLTSCDSGLGRWLVDTIVAGSNKVENVKEMAKDLPQNLLLHLYARAVELLAEGTTYEDRSPNLKNIDKYCE